MCGVLGCPPERHEHLGARTVPAGRDAVLGDQHPDLRRLLDALRLDPVNLPRPEPLRRVVAEHVPDRLTAELGILSDDRVQGPPDVIRVGSVR